MLEAINQPIDVLVAFLQKKVVPLSFSWAKKKYSIDQVNMVYKKKEGQNLFYIYTVMSEGAYYKLCFNTNDNKWLLEEAFYGS